MNVNYLEHVSTKALSNGVFNIVPYIRGAGSFTTSHANATVLATPVAATGHSPNGAMIVRSSGANYERHSCMILAVEMIFPSKELSCCPNPL